MDEKQWAEAVSQTSMNKNTVQKYLWDIKQKTVKFEIVNVKTGKKMKTPNLIQQG